jgi:hypothetical protein
MTEAETQAVIKEIEAVIKNGWGSVLIKIADHKIMPIAVTYQKNMEQLIAKN